MKILLESIWPILLLTALFVGGVYLFKYIVHRWFDHK